MRSACRRARTRRWCREALCSFQCCPEPVQTTHRLAKARAPRNCRRRCSARYPFYDVVADRNVRRSRMSTRRPCRRRKGLSGSVALKRRCQLLRCYAFGLDELARDGVVCERGRRPGRRTPCASGAQAVRGLVGTIRGTNRRARACDEPISADAGGAMAHLPHLSSDGSAPATANQIDVENRFRRRAPW